MNKQTTPQATLANWRNTPFSRWAFQHVRELIPTAHIACDRSKTKPLRTKTADDDLFAITCTGLDGQPWTIQKVLAETATDGLIVLQQGEVITEWYDNQLTPAQPHIIFSVSKSISSLLAGILIDRGLLDPAELVSHYLPEVAGSAYGDCTVQQVLDMMVGVAFDEAYLSTDGAFIRYREAMGWNPYSNPDDPPDLHSFLVTLQHDHNSHGSVFHYTSPNSDLLGWLLERVSDQSYAELLTENLWQPLGAEYDAYVTVDRLGTARSAGGICMSLRDMARIGELMRQYGQVDGRQIVPRWWIEDTLTAGDRDAWVKGDFYTLLPEGRYRNQWYQIGNENRAFCAIGIHGQWIYVDPTTEVVIVKMSSFKLPLNNPTDHLQLRAFAAVAQAFV